MTGCFEVKKARVRRRWYVVLRGSNGEVLSTSELLNDERTAYENIAAQKSTVPTADVVERG